MSNDDDGYDENGQRNKGDQNFHGNVGMVVGGDAHIHNQQEFDLWSLNLPQLYALRKRMSALLWKARTRLVFSPTMFFAALSVASIVYLGLTLTLFKILKQYQYASLAIPLLIFILGYMVQRKIRAYAPLIYTYKNDLYLIDSAIEHKKLGG